MGESRVCRSPGRALALLGLVGFGISIYALALHIKGAAGAAAGLGCDINDLFSCSNVLVGDYGAFLGIPLGGYGMAFFVVLMVTALLPLFTAASKAWHTRLQLGITSIGAAVSVGLAVFSAVVIKSICVVCSAVHVTCIVAFVIALVSYVRNTDKTLYTEGNPFMKWLSSSLAAAVPALLAGLIAPMIAPQILKGDDAKAPVLDMTKEAAPEALLSVARSRYVGKGEDFRKGNDDAKVVIQMFSDFQCPHCKVTAESIEAAIKKVGSDKVLFVYRNYPISNMCNASIGGAGNSKSCFFAAAARCAGQQGKFWEMKTWAFGFMGLDPAQIAAAASPEAASKHAAGAGLDAKVFDACVASGVELDKIRDDARIADQLGIKGTPMLYVNNRLYDGPRSPDDLALLFKSLAEAR